MWDICEFEDDSVSAVPFNWRIGDHECYWPPFKSQLKITDAIAKCVEPEHQAGWAIVKIKRTFCQADSYDQALDKVELALEKSDVDEEFNRREDKKTRYKRHRKLENSEDDCDIGELSKIDFPQPPPGCIRLQPQPLVNAKMKRKQTTSASSQSVSDQLGPHHMFNDDNQHFDTAHLTDLHERCEPESYGHPETQDEKMEASTGNISSYVSEDT
ncbi:hypothetical protein QAD02_002507 [Eretmocerus hayati]|uniref:Uncharacterized protein n=1 Tax=Eretmocerus hayati TaxID=131215 RepID=A0ACC2NK14_9HYME|nr:hypothetical protein QAD02_002507 [Eretmocerus hayati]